MQEPGHSMLVHMFEALALRFRKSCDLFPVVLATRGIRLRGFSFAEVSSLGAKAAISTGLQYSRALCFLSLTTMLYVDAFFVYLDE